MRNSSPNDFVALLAGTARSPLPPYVILTALGRTADDGARREEKSQ
ncbi:MAG: hypothetical protein ACOC2Y_03685 [Spirochaetota bacterium]